MIKRSVLKSFSQYNMPKVALSLLVALIVGIVILLRVPPFLYGCGVFA